MTTSPLSFILAQQAEGSTLLPPSASTNAPGTDWLFLFIWYVSAFFFLLIIALMVFFAWKYRRRHPEQEPRSRVTHSTPLELAWTIPPLIIVIFIFWVGLGGFMDISNPYGNAMRIEVLAKKWSWQFTYTLPNGSTYMDPALHVPVDRPIELVISSQDVIHSVFIPAFRVKRDAVPGKYNHLWFEPDEVGEYPLFCAEYCGTQHSAMVSKVVVHPPGEFKVWLEQASKSPFEDLDEKWYERWRSIESAEQYEQFKTELLEQTDFKAEDAEALEPAFAIGEDLYLKLGCNQCHSLDGTRLTGSSWKGLWGRQRVFKDGTTGVVDEDYVRESILRPQARIVETYGANMPSYQGQVTDRQIDAIIAFMRKLSDDKP